MYTHIAWRAARLAMLAGLLLGACGGHTFHGTIIRPPNPAPDFTLTTHSGQPFRLSEQRGKVVVLFFGFTHCPDVCPTALGDLAAVFRRLGADADQVQVAFVTIDPARDTPELMARYVTLFDQRFIGLSGSQAAIDPIVKAYGVAVQRRDLPGSALGYTMDHSAFLYVIDKTGAWGQLFGPDLTVDQMADDLRYIVREGAF